MTLSKFSALAILALSLSACELEVPSQMNTSRLELVETAQQNAYPVSDLDGSALQDIADHHKRYGQTPLMLTVTYDPSVSGAASAATRDGQRLGASLKAKGATNVHYETLPVAGQGKDRQVLVQYDSMTAQAPSDCGRIGGYDTSTAVSPDGARTEPDYKLGCSVEAVIAKQVARPSDLGGNTKMGPYDGARASGQLDDYRKGKELEKLQGQTASEQ